MSTATEVLQTALELVRQAEAAGIEVGQIMAYPHDAFPSLTLMAGGDSPRLAALLGLAERRTQDHDGAVLEEWRGMVGPVQVGTQHVVESLAVAS